jgi:hypothetical protein
MVQIADVEQATRTVGLLAKPFVPPKLTELRRNQVEGVQH